MKKAIILLSITAFLLNPLFPALGSDMLSPAPGQMTQLSPAFEPLLLKGIQIDPDNPLRFDFLINQGEEVTKGDRLKSSIERMVHYFFASLTIADSDLWVNLSPFEQERIISTTLERTAMGQDLLTQDYMLKQITSSLLYPESESGKKFWQEVYRQSQEKYGTTDIPMDTFNKVWIVPDKAIIEVSGHTALIMQSRLKVLLETDYLAVKEASSQNIAQNSLSDTHAISREITRKIIIPLLEKEINEGKNFVRLRQIYQSMIMAAWFKRTLQQSLLGREYAGQGKLTGIEHPDRNIARDIWQRYVESFKLGAFNVIKEEYDEFSGETIPRKYFSGGYQFDASMLNIIEVEENKITRALSKGRWIFARFVARPVREPQTMEEYLKYGRYRRSSGSMIRKVAGLAAVLVAGSLWFNPPAWMAESSPRVSVEDSGSSILDNLEFANTRTYTYYGVPFKGFTKDPVSLAYLLPMKSYSSGIKGFYFLTPEQEQSLKNQLGPFHFIAGDLNVPLLRSAMQGERASDAFLREKFEEAFEQTKNISVDDFTSLFNELLKIRNLYFLFSESVDEESFAPDIRLLIQKASQDMNILDDGQIERLNRAVMEAAYPQGIRKVLDRELGGVYYDRRVAVTTLNPATMTHEIFHHYWQNFLSEEDKEKFSSFYKAHREIFKEIRPSAREVSYAYHINSPEEGFTELAATYVANPALFTSFARKYKDIGVGKILGMVVSGFADLDRQTETVTLRIYRKQDANGADSLRINPINTSFPAGAFTLEKALQVIEKINAPDFDNETKGGIDLDSALLRIDESGDKFSFRNLVIPDSGLEGIQPVMIGIIRK